MKKHFILPIFLAVFPALPAIASVHINEIAWMGTTDSASNEWVELVNEGASVDLSGWKIVAQDGAPDITLSGTIAVNGYYLIERTDDTTVPTVTADLVAPFGAGLSNSGEILKLIDGTGAVLETIDGSESWKTIGGDNTTKDTAQRTSGGWITAHPTPRAANETVNVLPPSAPAKTTSSSANVGSTSDNSATPATSGGPASSAKSVPETSIRPAVATYPRKEITVKTESSRSVTTGIESVFSAYGTGLYDEPLTYATFHWNFGDGAIGEGATTTHVYRNSGIYIASVEVISGANRTTNRITVTVSNATVSINTVATGSDAFIVLENKSGSDMDLSGWTLSAHLRVFIFPPHTFLGANGKGNFPKTVTTLDPIEGDTVLLSLPSGKNVAQYILPLPVTTLVEVPQVPISQQVATLFGSVVHPSPGPAKIIPFQPSAPVLLAETVATSTGNQIATAGAGTLLYDRSATRSSSGALLWPYALSGLLLATVAGVALSRSRVDKPTLADEYAIVEDLDGK